MNAEHNIGEQLLKDPMPSVSIEEMQDRAAEDHADAGLSLSGAEPWSHGIKELTSPLSDG